MPRKVVQLRPITVVGDIALVTLTNGYVAEIDADDVALVARYNWRTAFCKSKIPYASTWASQKNGTKTLFLLHRYLLNAGKGQIVDHVDGNPLNNRRANLRIATPSQNGQNKRVGRNNTSGFKGVSWYSGRNCWKASIMLNGKREELGFFTSVEAAAAAYATAARRKFGPFARVT